VTIAGVAGNVTQESHVNCSADAQVGCVTVAAFKAANMTNVVAGNIKTGVTIAGVAGNVTQESHSDCSSDAQVGCVTVAAFKAANMTSVVAGNIKSGVTIAGVAGNVTQESHSDCSLDAQVGCVTTASFKAANMTNVTAGTVKDGVTIAGVVGDYPSSTYPLPNASAIINDLDSTTFNAKMKSSTQFEYFDSAGARYTGAGDADIVASKIASGTTIFDVAGSATLESHSNCSSDAQVGCVTVSAFKAANMTNVVAGNIKTGVTIAGVAGSVTQESHSNCSSDAQVGCVTVSAFKAADMTRVTAGTVKSGTTIAGVAGNYPSATYPLPGENPSVDTLTTANFNSKATGSGYFEWWGADGTHMWLTSGDTDIVAGNIKSGVNIFGVAGNVTAESHSNCSSDAQVGCITTTSYKAANMTNVTAGNVKDGVVIAGITGDYPSSTYPLSGASATADLDSATFNAKVKASTSFEYWNSAGTRQTGAGDVDIDATKIKSGVNVFGTTGTYAFSNNPPNLSAGTTKTLTRNVTMTSFDAGIDGTDDLDVDGDTITYTCTFDTDADWAVAPNGTVCSTANLANGTSFAFNTSTGVISGWVPSTATSYDFLITGCDAYYACDSVVFKIVVDAGCAGDLVGGYCWYLSGAGESCDDICSTHGGYNSATASYAGSSGSDAQCQAAANAVYTGGSWGGATTSSFGVGCKIDMFGSIKRITSPATSSSAINGSDRRVCACNQ
jgi:hypothetical protein